MLTFAGKKVEELSTGYSVDVDPGSGTASLQIPVIPPPGRDNLTPPLLLSYTSGSSNSAFGVGWNLTGLSAVGINTTRNVARWDGSDSYQIGGDELVPWLEQQVGKWVPRGFDRGDWTVGFYRSRRGNSHLRVEKWLHRPTNRIHFRARDSRNLLTIYGARPNAAARIADSADESRTLLWLPELMIDPMGNAMWIDYLGETPDAIDRSAANERRGLPMAQRYLKRIRYGNTTPIVLDDNILNGTIPAGPRWCFQVVLDYGDHDPGTPTSMPDRAWPVRLDPFSMNRQGFEVRTWRLCRRIMSFHDFPELGAQPTPVSALVLTHTPDPAGTTVTQVARVGYRRDGGVTTSKSLPPLKMTYAGSVTPGAFMGLPALSQENVPAGFAQRRVLFIDLLGEGLPGILTETDRAWLYKQNRGDGNFSAQALVLDRPAVPGHIFGLGDMDGDGNTDASQLTGRFAGLFERDTEHDEWKGFRPFPTFPHVEALRDRICWVDLNGDGLSDILISREDHFVWYPSQGEGFAAAQEVPRPDGPDAVPILKSDPSLDFFFADMDGDGMVDFVRVSNGCVEYWPGLGQGRFGDRVIMGDAPMFDDTDSFEARRIRFVDLDGSGTSDIVYLGRGEVSCWMNASGNRLIAGPQLAGLPFFDSVSSVRIFDFLGDGRACLVWSNPLPGREAPLQYLPLTPNVPARMLVQVDDGLGHQVKLTYGSSARQYLRDVADGRGWKTRLPSHRMVVERKEDIELLGGGRLVRTYAYRDGYFDGDERTARAFGQVDIVDAEIFTGPNPPETYTPPSLTRLWFHLGTPMWDRHRPMDIYDGDAVLPWLGEHVIEDADQLSASEIEDGLRTLGGQLIRREVYTLDVHGIPGPHPFAVEQERHRLRRLQPALADAPAAFFALRLEKATWTYEQTAGDPRLDHEILLALDGYDQPLRQGSINYARRVGKPRDVAAQDRNWLYITDVKLLNFDLPDRYELGIPTENSAFDLVGVRPAKTLFAREELSAPAVTSAIAAPLTHETDPADDPVAGPRARLLKRERKFYWNDARNAALAFGQAGSIVLVHHDETASFSPAFIATVLAGRMNAAGLTALGYIQNDGLWWLQSETHTFDGPAGFFQRLSVRRADGAQTSFTYDLHRILIASVADTLGNVQSAINDYNRLAPAQITDENGSIEEARYDPLGVIVATSRSGHVNQQPWGFDALNLVVDRVPADLSSAIANPFNLIQGAASYVWYDLDAFTRDGTPSLVLTLQRFDLRNDGSGAGTPANAGRIGIAVGYLDGFGRPLQTKSLTESGPAIQRDGGGAVVVDGSGQPVLANAAMRWSVSGHTIYDSKQQPIRVYEPFYSPTAAFESDAVLRQIGFATLTLYDAIGRMTAQHAPNGTLIRVTIGPWQLEDADPNDTVMESTWRAVREALPLTSPERIALEQTKDHADTVKITFLDPMARPVASLVKGGTTAADRRIASLLDIEGLQREIIDPRGLRAFTYQYDMLGRLVAQTSVDAGPMASLTDSFGRDSIGWDARGFITRRGYDLADRPTFIEVTGGDGPAPMNHRVVEYVYGEAVADIADARRRNLRGRQIAVRDPAGERRIDLYDPGGQILVSAFQMRTQVDIEPDWRQATPLEAEVIHSVATFDGIGRVVSDTLADGSVRRYEYDGGGALTRIRLTTPDGLISNVPILDGVEVGSRGERYATTLGNGARITYAYDPATDRLAQQTSTMGARTLQQLRYTYDPIGNIVRIADAAQEGAGALITGMAIPAVRDHIYDAHYRLRQATGRVHQALLQWDMVPGAVNTVKGTRRVGFNDGAAVERYTRTYTFDASGNMTRMRHVGATRNWTTDFWVSPTSNRSLAALDPNGNPLANAEAKFDAGGNVRELPHLRQMEWNWSGNLARAVVISRPGGTDDAEIYIYTSDGARILRRTTRVISPALTEVIEKAYFGDAERKRILRNGALVLERWSLNIGDGSQRFAFVDRWTRDDFEREVDDISQPRVRYQLSTPQQSAVMELDSAGLLISYEEYFPFGETAFVAGDNVREVERREYRYSGKERDDFTGLYYYGYRYLMPWMGRWLSPDPIGPEDDINLYQFVRGNPISNYDADGLDTVIQLDSVSKKVKSPAAVMRQFNKTRAIELGWEATAVVQLPSGDWLITQTRPIPPDVLETARKIHDLELARTLNDLTAVMGKGSEYSPWADNAGVDPPGEGGEGAEAKKQGEEGGTGGKGSGGKTGGGTNADAGNGGKGDVGKGKDAKGTGGGGKPQDGNIVDDPNAKDGKAGGAGVGRGKGDSVGDGSGKDPNAPGGKGGSGSGGNQKKGGAKGGGGSPGGTSKEPGGTKVGGDPNGIPGGHGTTPGGDSKDPNAGNTGDKNGGSTDPNLTPSATGQPPPPGVTKQGSNPNGVVDGGTNDTGMTEGPGGGQGTNSKGGVAGGTGDSASGKTGGGGPGGGAEGKDGGVPGGDADGLVGGGGTHKLPGYLKWMNYVGKGLQFVGAVLEIAAGIAMLIVPEPTVTKVGGVILILHGLDSLQALIRGERTYTAKAATGLARTAGASDKNAELIGDIADIAVPLLAGGLGGLGRAGAARGWKIPGFKVTPGWKIPGTGGYANWIMRGAQNDAAFRGLSRGDKKLYELGQRTLSNKDFAAMQKALGSTATASTVEAAIARGAWLKTQKAGTLFGNFSPSWLGIVKPGGTLGTGPSPAVRMWGWLVFPIAVDVFQGTGKLWSAAPTEATP